MIANYNTNGASPNGAAEYTPDDLTSDLPLTLGYKPSIPGAAFWNASGIPQYQILRDVEAIMSHPQAILSMAYYRSGIANAEFDIKAPSSALGTFIAEQVERFWNVGVPKLQISYEYGWAAAEPMYEEKGGAMAWSHFLDFSPRDVYVLTRNAEYYGVRVKNIRAPGEGQTDLLGEEEARPAKGFWYGHKTRFQQWYGISQLLGMWMPWSRLSRPDGLEYVTDQALYRFGVAGPIFRYPPLAWAKVPGSPQGAPTFQDGRSMARQWIEQVKSGGGIALPSNKYSADQGGGYKWEVSTPDHTINVSGLLEAIQYLEQQMTKGCEVPPELLEAQETASGYSGRAIPLEAFLMLQQHNADAMLAAFIRQCLAPCVNFNFGKKQRWSVQVKSLLKSRLAQGQQGQGQGGTQPGMDASGGAAPPGGGMTGMDAGMQVPGKPGAPAEMSIGSIAGRVRQKMLGGADARTRAAATGMRLLAESVRDKGREKEELARYREEVKDAVQKRGWVQPLDRWMKSVNGVA